MFLLSAICWGLIQTLAPADEVSIFLYSDGTNRHYIVQGRERSPEQIKEVLRPLSQANPFVIVPITVHPRTQIREVVALIHLMRAVGLTNIVVEMREQPSEFEPVPVRLRVEYPKRYVVRSDGSQLKTLVEWPQNGVEVAPDTRTSKEGEPGLSGGCQRQTAKRENGIERGIDGKN